MGTRSSAIDLDDTAVVETNTIQRSLLIDSAPGERLVRKETPAPEIILEEMEELAYSADWQVVDDADYGVPQHRDRVFFIGVRDGDLLPDLDRWRTHRKPKSDEERTMGVRKEPGVFTDSSQTTFTTEPALPSFERDDTTRQPYLTVAY